MILRRVGVKTKIADKIKPYFPPHEVYVEPFFGAGGMFFNKPKAPHNIVNDLDSDVYNLFHVLLNQKEALEEKFSLMPFHEDLLREWKQKRETDPVMKAIRFLFMSNYTLYGAGNTLRSKPDRSKQICINNFIKTLSALRDVQFFNRDFREFIKGLSIKHEDNQRWFIYADPPYLHTKGSCYDTGTEWTEKDSYELFEVLEETQCKYMISEFQHPFLLKQVEKRNLHLINLGERVNLKNRRTEIIIMNYQPHPTIFNF